MSYRGKRKCSQRMCGAFATVTFRVPDQPPKHGCDGCAPDMLKQVLDDPSLPQSVRRTVTIREYVPAAAVAESRPPAHVRRRS